MPKRCCVVPTVLAYFSIAYLAASFVYIMVSCIGRWGTPFKNSLSAHQLKLKKQSSIQRGCLFGISFAILLVVLFLWRPMMKCTAE
jgi:hypothetical protein